MKKNILLLGLATLALVGCGPKEKEEIQYDPYALLNYQENPNFVGTQVSEEELMSMLDYNNDIYKNVTVVMFQYLDNQTELQVVQAINDHKIMEISNDNDHFTTSYGFDVSNTFYSEYSILPDGNKYVYGETNCTVQYYSVGYAFGSIDGASSISSSFDNQTGVYTINCGNSNTYVSFNEDKTIHWTKYDGFTFYFMNYGTTKFEIPLENYNFLNDPQNHHHIY